ncbi:FtsK/SpoIIIE domain-containing protein [Georgenia sp.]
MATMLFVRHRSERASRSEHDDQGRDGVRPRRGRPGGAPPLDPAAVLLAAAAGVPRSAPGTTLEVSLLAPLARSWRRLRLRLRGDWAQPPGELRLQDGDRVALVGRAVDVDSTVRWIGAQLTGRHGPADLLVAGAGYPRSARTPLLPSTANLGSRPGQAAPPPGVHRRGEPPWHVVVAVPTDPPHEGTGPRTAHLGPVGRPDRVPPWCTRVVVVPELAQVLSPRWADAVAGLVAATDPASTASTLPSTVPLADLLGPVDALAARWEQPPAGLTVPLGVGVDGVVELDLAAAGPHALVAGTTGSGKSELLLSWLLGLAVRYSPRDVQLVLVDYKGGATFAPLAGLPHTAGVLTDLDPSATSRALTSLRAEVRRRERILAAAGARDLADYLAARGGRAGTGPGGRAATGPGDDALPRLMVVVDEFRALADEHPEVLAALVRLAAQGRSLGIHLVLATQRPGGAVSADMRANLTVRLSLRVLEPADSVDVLGTPDAAVLSAVPGRALLRTDRIQQLQLPFSGPGPDLPRALVAATGRAWRASGGPAAPPRPWAPELPAHVTLAGLPGLADGGPELPLRAQSGVRLPLAVSDLPEEQRLGAWAWTTPALLVTGGPGTGRTETLRTVVAQALAAGVPVHVVAAHPERFADLTGSSLGTVVGADDPRRTARLFELLRDATDPVPTAQVLVVDDADVVCDLLDLTGPGRGVPALARVLREARRAGLAVALSGPPSLSGARWTEAVRTRLVLAPRDGTEALLAGVPRDHLAPPRPGRGVLLEPGRVTSVQVALTGTVALPGPPRPGVLRLAALPRDVRLAHLAPPAAGPATAFTIGLGGDGGGPVEVPGGPGDHLLVVGPPGSGRSTTLAAAAAQLEALGRSVVTARPGPSGASPPNGAVLVLDDADRWPATDLDALGELLRARPDLSVLAATTTDAAAAAYRGPVATWRASATLLVLRPAQGPTAQLTAVDLAPTLEPSRPFHPGLGTLVRAGRAVPVQVARP